MGNPSDVFTDFKNTTQLRWLEDLMKQIAERYVEKYGLEYVSRWNFETWNEPDHRKTWDYPLNDTDVDGYLNYFDAIRAGLTHAHNSFKLGGPGGSCRPPHFVEFCHSLLRHCETKMNMNCLDFIAFHKKGARKGGTPSAQRILDQEKATIDVIRKNYPRLRKLPVFNDEGDPEVGWSEPRPWRADVTYASMAVKIIAMHLDRYKRDSDLDFRLLSNDNAFLSYFPYQFEQRTLLARFQMNGTSTADLKTNFNASPSWVQFFVKPIHSAISMLSYLGEIKLVAHSSDTDGIVGAIASAHFPETMLADRKDSPQLAALIYGSNDSERVFASTKRRVKVEIQLPHYWTAHLDDLKIMEFSMSNDRRRGNPYTVWIEMGRPAFPDFDHSRRLRAYEAPSLNEIDGKVSIANGTLSREFAVRGPTVKLIHICRRGVDPIGKPVCACVSSAASQSS